MRGMIQKSESQKTSNFVGGMSEHWSIFSVSAWHLSYKEGSNQEASVKTIVE
jgi:hypothetical protein